MPVNSDVFELVIQAFQDKKDITSRKMLDFELESLNTSQLYIYIVELTDQQ